jgi:hypothetical protein
LLEARRAHRYLRQLLIDCEEDRTLRSGDFDTARNAAEVIPDYPGGGTK